MLSQEKIDLIRQAKMNALSAKYLHEKRGARYHHLSRVIDFLTIAVPAFYFVPRFLFKGHSGAEVVEVVWELLAGSLLVLALLKLVFRWDDKAGSHANLRAANIRRVREADELLGKAKTASDENANWFLRLVEADDTADGAILANLKPAERQEAFRAALQEFNPGSADTVCHACFASPWNFQPGSCQMCGGTPVAPADWFAPPTE